MVVLVELMESIDKALKSKNWYAALTMTLMLPDICGKIDNPKMKSAERYIKWFNQYIKPDYGMEMFMEGGDCYAIRCAILHSFSEDLTEHKAKKIVAKYKFYSPEKLNCGISTSIKETGSELDIKVTDFCERIRIGVNKWKIETKPNFDERLFMKIL